MSNPEEEALKETIEKREDAGGTKKNEGMRPVSVSIVDTPVQLYWRTQDGRYLAVDWEPKR